MIELRRHRLEVSFPEVHADARCTIEFQRTLRIPDDNRDYPLPAGLGQFPLAHVDDFADRLPEAESVVHNPDSTSPGITPRGAPHAGASAFRSTNWK